MKITHKVGRKPKPVKQMTLNGELITVYKSVTEAAQETGLSAGNISAVCSGKHKQTNGFKWAYIE